MISYTYRTSGPTTTVHLSLGLRVMRRLVVVVDIVVEKLSAAESTLRNSMFDAQCRTSLTQYINQHFYYSSNKPAESTANHNCFNIN
jgi:hypothetical protein